MPAMKRELELRTVERIEIAEENRLTELILTIPDETGRKRQLILGRPSMINGCLFLYSLFPIFERIESQGYIDSWLLGGLELIRQTPKASHQHFTYELLDCYVRSGTAEERKKLIKKIRKSIRREQRIEQLEKELGERGYVVLKNGYIMTRMDGDYYLVKGGDVRHIYYSRRILQHPSLDDGYPVSDWIRKRVLERLVEINPNLGFEIL